MYMDIHQLLKQGFSKVQVAEKLNISRSTIYRYLERNPDTMSEWVKKTKVRRKKLDSPYDNTCIESFHAILKKEEVNHVQYLDFNAARVELFKYIEG